MIRLEWYIRHRTEVGKAAFQRAWGGELGPRLLAFGESLKAERLVQLSLVETSANLGLTEARGGDMEAFFDGIIELWWPTRAAMEAALSADDLHATFEKVTGALTHVASLEDGVIFIAAEHPQVNPSPETLLATPDSGVSKLQFPLRTYQDRSLADVRAYWLEEHGPLIRKNAVVSSIVRYVQVHRIDSNWNERLAELSQSESEPYLGHAEVWVARSGSSATDEERALASKAAVHDEAKFIDFARSTLFFVEEAELISREPGVAYNP